MPSDTPGRAPEWPPIRLFELSPIDRTCIKRLVGHTLVRIEREFILQTLRQCRGNRTRSADMLGISLRSLRDKIRRYRDEGQDVPDRDIGSVVSLKGSPTQIDTPRLANPA